MSINIKMDKARICCRISARVTGIITGLYWSLALILSGLMERYGPFEVEGIISTAPALANVAGIIIPWWILKKVPPRKQ